MDTAAISYRVADFLKKYPPFNAMEEEDLVQLARRGRVKFFEPNQYVLSQGGSRLQVLVIQQGTVSLWDERGNPAKLLDVRGTGDMLGIDQYNEVRSNPYSARSASDVLIYAFPADEFEILVRKYPYAEQYVSAYGSVTAEYRLPGASQQRRDPQDVFLHEVVAGKILPACDALTTIREAARSMLTTGNEAIVVLDSNQKARAVLSAKSFLEWIAGGRGDGDEPVTALFGGIPVAIGADASIADGVLAMGAADATALAITADGTPDSRVHAIVTSQDVGQVFGDRPIDILRQISRTADAAGLRELNQRARALVLHHLKTAASADWLARFISSVDTNIMRRLTAIAGAEETSACWCFCGPSGRGESLTNLAPRVVMISDDGHHQSRGLDTYQRVMALLDECGYLPNTEKVFEPSFYAATVGEWKRRYSDWLNDPILKEIYRARPFFDLRPILGQQSLWQDVEAAVTGAITRELLHVVANDCLATLPPLTFFQNAVVDETGEETAVFRLEDTAIRPLVDVGRVFGMAARKVLASSTLERFAMARTLLPERASIFQEASDTLRVVLWQQGRAGLSEGTAGAELPPALLSRYDRQTLRSGFRSILRLLEFTGDLKWLESL